MDNELLKKIQDSKYYLENFCKIKTKQGGLHPFLLNEAQKDLFNCLRTDRRVIISKARQIGFSTAATGWIYHKTITTPGVTSALIGYNSDLTAELLDKVKTFWRTTPEALRPTIQYNSKYEITFPKIDSKILVLPSTENVGRGYTLSGGVLCTEVAFWDKDEEKMVALENSVPATGTIIVESTPQGMANWYYRQFMAKENGYTKKSYGWWWHYTEEEIEVIRMRMNNPRKFAQEYSLEFLASGRLVFEASIIKNQSKTIVKLGEEIEHKDGTVTMVHDWEGLRVYKEPDSDVTYVIGVDTAEGVEGGDYSTCIILNRATGEEVAFYRGLCQPDKFGVLLNAWGRKYNNALMVVEVNNHGLTVLTILKQMMYPTLYFRPSKFETISTGYSDRLGWRTTQLTRPLMMDDLLQYLRDNLLTLHSQEIIGEMTTFVYDKANKAVAMSGSHDDCIMACAIAVQGFKVIWQGSLDQVDYSQHLPGGGYAY